MCFCRNYREKKKLSHELNNNGKHQKPLSQFNEHYVASRSMAQRAHWSVQRIFVWIQLQSSSSLIRSGFFSLSRGKTQIWISFFENDDHCSCYGKRNETPSMSIGIKWNQTEEKQRTHTRSKKKQANVASIHLLQPTGIEHTICDRKKCRTSRASTLFHWSSSAAVNHNVIKRILQQRLLIYAAVSLVSSVRIVDLNHWSGPIDVRLWASHQMHLAISASIVRKSLISTTNIRLNYLWCSQFNSFSAIFEMRDRRKKHTNYRRTNIHHTYDIAQRVHHYETRLWQPETTWMLMAGAKLRRTPCN